MSYFAGAISDASVELLALNNEEIFVRFDNTALGGDRSGCVEVIACDHSDRDASLLALPDSVRYFWPHRILDPDNTKACQIIHNVIFVLPIRFVFYMHLINFSFARYKFAKSDTNSPKTITSHRFNNLF